MTDDDGVALFSVAHPQPSFWRRVWFWLFGPRDVRATALEPIELDEAGANSGSLGAELRSLPAVLFGTDIPDPDVGPYQKPSGYRTVHTNTPPVLAVEDGRLVIKLIAGDLTVVAGVGDGRYFFSQVVSKLVDPALLARHEAASPND